MDSKPCLRNIWVRPCKKCKILGACPTDVLTFQNLDPNYEILHHRHFWLQGILRTPESLRSLLSDSMPSSRFESFSRLWGQKVQWSEKNCIKAERQDPTSCYKACFRAIKHFLELTSKSSLVCSSCPLSSPKASIIRPETAINIFSRYTDKSQKFCYDLGSTSKNPGYKFCTRHDWSIINLPRITHYLLEFFQVLFKPIAKQTLASRYRFRSILSKGPPFCYNFVYIFMFNKFNLQLFAVFVPCGGMQLVWNNEQRVKLLQGENLC